MSSCLTNKKPEIDYPCLWQYKVIGTAKHEILEAISSVIGEMEHSISESKSSSKGKYLSINLEIMVDSEDMRNLIFKKLQSHPNLKMII
ncbi:MAG: DUF493 domain-containing protein [Thermodesulfobacteriota bacterium]